MKGYELLKEIAEGNITKALVKDKNENRYIIEIPPYREEKAQLFEFCGDGVDRDCYMDTYDLLYNDFTIIKLISGKEEINIQDIEELYINDIKSIGESEIKCWTGRNLDLVLGNKINELVQAVKYLDEKLKEK